MNRRNRRRVRSGACGSTRRLGAVLIVLLGTALVASAPAQASLARSAAGAKNMGESGLITVDTAAQLEDESDGKSWVAETGVQVQASDRLQLLVEAVLYERTEPDSGRVASGLGDTELTVSWIALKEKGMFPPVVLAAKVKLPTARNDEIGTGRADYSGLLVLGKELGELELNVEAEYATFGSPSGKSLKDQFIYTLGAEYGLNDYLAVYTEVFGNSAPAAGESRTDAALLGLEVDIPLREDAAPYLSFEMDTESTATARAGIEWTW